ncbi:MAG: hypothetical protein H6734_14235 [Alphaproteobacteria bacterium]|nr:hypothetical protein [Alphaproteobacteria bacterium]
MAADLDVLLGIVAMEGEDRGAARPVRPHVERVLASVDGLLATLDGGPTHLELQDLMITRGQLAAHLRAMDGLQWPQAAIAPIAKAADLLAPAHVDGLREVATTLRELLATPDATWTPTAEQVELARVAMRAIEDLGVLLTSGAVARQDMTITVGRGSRSSTISTDPSMAQKAERLILHQQAVKDAVLAYLAAVPGTPHIMALGGLTFGGTLQPSELGAQRQSLEEVRAAVSRLSGL